MLSQAEEFIADLVGEFSSRHKDKELKALCAGDFVHDGQAESGGLSRAGQGLSDEVMTLHNREDGLALDRSRLSEACLFDALHYFLAEAETVEICDAVFFHW